MRSERIGHYIETLYEQREDFYQHVDNHIDDVWEQPVLGKWSVAETLYHLLLMARLFRRSSVFYIPLLYPLAYLRKSKSYPTHITNIYSEYQQNKRKPMRAPFLLIPPRNLHNKKNLEEIKRLLEQETDKLIRLIHRIDEDVAGQMYYPDPIAHYPNLIQSIQLLAIHEQHHYQLTKQYYSSRNQDKEKEAGM